jgi:hypothetical protein
MKIKIWVAIAHYKKLCGFTICCCFKVQLGIVTAMIPWIHNTFLSTTLAFGILFLNSYLG